MFADTLYGDYYEVTQVKLLQEFLLTENLARFDLDDFFSHSLNSDLVEKTLILKVKRNQ